MLVVISSSSMLTKSRQISAFDETSEGFSALNFLFWKFGHPGKIYLCDKDDKLAKC